MLPLLAGNPKWDHTLLIAPSSGNNSTDLAPEDEYNPSPLAMILTGVARLRITDYASNEL